jgi:hypothetical protein
MMVGCAFMAVSKAHQTATQEAVNLFHIIGLFAKRESRGEKDCAKKTKIVCTTFFFKEQRAR